MELLTFYIHDNNGSFLTQVNKQYKSSHLISSRKLNTQTVVIQHRYCEMILLSIYSMSCGLKGLDKESQGNSETPKQENKRH